MKSNKIKIMVLCGFGIALVFSLSAFVSVPIGQFGYVNLGDSALMLFASILNPFYAFLVGGIGSAIADMYLGYSQYALFTIIIKGLEGFVIAILCGLHKKIRPLAYLLGMVLMVFGYFLCDAFINQSFIVALSGIGFNFLQGIVCLLTAVLFSKLFVKAANKYLNDK